MFEMITKHYLDTDNLFVKPFTMTALDIHRDAIYNVNFHEIILKNITDNRFDYGQEKINQPDFTMTLSFNWYDVEFLLTKSKVLELDKVPQIIQKI